MARVGRKLAPDDLKQRQAYCQRVHDILKTCPGYPRQRVRGLFQEKKTKKSAMVLTVRLVLEYYCTRLRLVQYIAFAKQLGIRWGELCIDWAVLLELGHYFFKGYSGYDSTDRQSDNRELFGRFLDQTPRAWFFDRMPEMVRAVQILEQHAKELRNPGTYLPLGTVLVEYAFKECSVPHDQIFGLLGLSRSTMKIDYNIHFLTLYIRAFTEGLIELWQCADFPEDDWLAKQEAVALISALLKCLLPTHPCNPAAFAVTFTILAKLAGPSTAMANTGAASMSASTWAPSFITFLDQLPKIVEWWLAPVWWAWSFL